MLGITLRRSPRSALFDAVVLHSRAVHRQGRRWNLNPNQHDVRLESLEERQLLSSTYAYDVIDQTGASVNGFQPLPAINSIGNVGFVSELGSTTHENVDIGTNPGVSSSISVTRQFSQFLQINDSNQVVAQDLGSAGGVVETFIRIWNSSGSTIVDQAGVNQGVFAPYDVVYAPSINNNGDVTFVGSSANSGNPITTLAMQTAGGTDTVLTTLAANTAPLRPEISNNDTVVVRDGNATTSPIMLYNTSGSTTVASSPLWTELGQSPGITPDGSAVIFQGTPSVATAAALGFSGGAGVFFYSVATQAIYQIASVTTNAPYSSFDTASRVSISTDPADPGDYHVAFLATGTDTNYGLYSSEFNNSSSGLSFVSNPRPVIEVGDTVTGFGVINSISAGDALNSTGQIAFWASTASNPSGVAGQAIIRTNGTLHVLSVGINDPATTILGGNTAMQVGNAFGSAYNLLPENDREVSMASSASDNFLSIQNAIKSAELTVHPGDTFVFYVGSHGAFSNIPDPSHPPVYAEQPSPAPPILETGDAAIWLGFAGGGSSYLMTDNELASLFNDSTWNQVNKLFVIDTCYSASFWQSQLGQLPKSSLIAASAYNSSQDLSKLAYYEGGIGCLGASVVNALGQLSGQSISISQLFQAVQADGYQKNSGNVFQFQNGPGNIASISPGPLVNQSVWGTTVPINFSPAEESTGDFTLGLPSTGHTPPVAVNDSATTSQNTAALVNVLANDTDADGTIDPTSLAIVSGPTSGTVSANPTTGVITYTPNTGFAGNDTFAYTVNDTLGATSNAATVTVTVQGTNMPAKPVVTLNPESQNVSAGAFVSFSTTASGNPTPTVQWQVSNNSGMSFSSIPGASSTTYNFSAVASQSGDEYQAVFNNSQGIATTLAATLIVSSPLLTLTGPAFYIELDPNGQQLDTWNNSTGTGTMLESPMLSSVSAIVVTGTGTSNSLTVDFSNGDPLVASGLKYNGTGSAQSTLNVVGTSGDNLNASDSSVTIIGTFGSVPISYVNSAISFYPPNGSGVVNQSIGTLSVSATGKLAIKAPASADNRNVLVVQTLSVAGGVNNWLGQLDLAGNDLVVRGGSISMISNMVNSGYNAASGPLWSGNGITSSSAAGNTTHLTALGAIFNTVDGTSTGAALYGSGTNRGLFDGVSPASSDVLIKYTYYGDANLDGAVDGSDYSRIDNGYLSHLSGWSNGDFNYDGSINGSDYTLIDNAFNTQGASLAASVAGRVPGPGTALPDHISSSKQADSNSILVPTVPTAADSDE
jgi:hypothetical protein